MYPDWNDPLLPLMATYHAAIVRSSGLQARLRHAIGDSDLLTRSLAADEQVIAARSALYRALIDLDWTPPPHVVTDLDHDSDLLHLYGY